MGERLGEREVETVASLARELAVVRPGEPALGERVMEALAAIGVPYPHGYGLRGDGSDTKLDVFVGRGFHVGSFRQAYEQHWHTLIQSWLFRPHNVERRQRNRVLMLNGAHVSSEPRQVLTAAWRRVIPGFDDQMRVLICDGPAMLAWVGGFSTEQFTWRERDKLQVLTPALRRRLLHERRVREAGLVNAAMDAVLEALPGPALLLDARHRPVHRNRAARGLKLDVSAMDVTPVEVVGLPRHYLARDLGATTGPASPQFAAHFGLTTQEARVMSLLAQGHSNRAIAVVLDCSERTVEVHVSRILAKTDCETRGEVVARAWTFAG